MSRFTAWVLVLYALAVTGFAAYELAFVQHLQFIIKLLAGGQVQ